LLFALKVSLQATANLTDESLVLTSVERREAQRARSRRFAQAD
jgi:hypothetical protein